MGESEPAGRASADRMGESEPAGRASADGAEWSNHMMTQSSCDRAAILCSTPSDCCMGTGSHSLREMKRTWSRFRLEPLEVR